MEIFVQVLWGIFVGIQFLFWGLIFVRLAVYRPKSNFYASCEGVSVVICARNEHENLRKYLPSVLHQDYPDFEVIVVNDASTDQSQELLEEYQKSFARLRIVHLTEKMSLGKKAALRQGIDAAKNDWVLLTDADCQPSSKHWIQAMQAEVEPNTNVVLGYGPYNKYPEMINAWIRFETVYTALQYLSFCLWGMPYMGVGRNLMYRKSLLNQRKKLIKGEHLASGDDDLWVNQMAEGKSTKICLDPNSFMYSEPKRSFKALYRQKTRHYSTSTYYRWQHQLALGSLVVSHFAYYGLGLLLVGLDGNFSVLFSLTLGIRLILYYLIANSVTSLLNERDLLKNWWFFDIFMPIYYIIFAPSLFISSKKTWE
ncbi:MAG: glycosyltransferase [Saprospiraceae bacterium]|nr:glycosyltransferase [Saprospiraceae bacterium]